MLSASPALRSRERRTEMRSWRSLLFLLHLFVLLCVLPAAAAPTSSLGVNFGNMASHPLPGKAVIEMLRANGISKVKLFDADHQVLEAFRGASDMELMIAIRNEMLEKLAADPAAAADWVRENVTKFLTPDKNSVNIRYVAVANEPFLQAFNTMYKATLYPAVKNVAAALAAAGLKDKVKVTVPFNADVVTNASPNNLPSAGVFRADMADEVKKILAVLKDTGSPFTINIYPFLSLQQNPNFPRDFAFFNDTAHSITDDGGGAANGVKATTYVYTNVFDAAHDLALAALTEAGYSDMEIIIGEIGWPTDGDPAATPESAQSFVGELAKHVLTGTPRRPGKVQTYLFSLTDEDQKSTLPGNFERHWGLFAYDGQPKYNVDISGKGDSNAKLVPAKMVKYMPQKWCVADESSDPATLGSNVDFACKYADCTSLQSGSSCTDFGTVVKASYAFNSYYQLNNQDNSTCKFEGNGKITTMNPSQGRCKFLLQLDINSTEAAAASSTSSPSNQHGPRNSSFTLRVSSWLVLLVVIVTLLV